MLFVQPVEDRLFQVGIEVAISLEYAYSVAIEGRCHVFLSDKLEYSLVYTCLTEPELVSDSVEVNVLAKFLILVIHDFKEHHEYLYIDQLQQDYKQVGFANSPLSGAMFESEIRPVDFIRFHGRCQTDFVSK